MLIHSNERKAEKKSSCIIQVCFVNGNQIFGKYSHTFGPYVKLIYSTLSYLRLVNDVILHSLCFVDNSKICDKQLKNVDFQLDLQVYMAFRKS